MYARLQIFQWLPATEEFRFYEFLMNITLFHTFRSQQQ